VAQNRPKSPDAGSRGEVIRLGLLQVAPVVAEQLGDDHQVKLWDTTRHRRPERLASHADRVLCVAFSAEGDVPRSDLPPRKSAFNADFRGPIQLRGSNKTSRRPSVGAGGSVRRPATTREPVARSGDRPQRGSWWLGQETGHNAGPATTRDRPQRGTGHNAGPATMRDPPQRGTGHNAGFHYSTALFPIRFVL
jgi:hypothetical protein